MDVLHTELKALETQALPVEQKIKELGERVISLRQDLGLAEIQQQHLKKEMEPEEQVFRRRELQGKEETSALYEQKHAAKRDEIRRKSEEITNAERRVQRLQLSIKRLEGSRVRTEVEAQDLRRQGQTLISAADRKISEHQAAIANSKAELRRLVGTTYVLS